MKQSVKFKFKEAVREATRDHSMTRSKITFIDASTPDARGKFNAAIAGFSPRAKKLLSDKKQTSDELFDAIITDVGSCMFVDPVTRKKIVVIDTKNSAGLIIGDVQFIFDHEVGHSVTQRGHEYMINNFGSYFIPLHEITGAEITAELYAVMRGFARGSLTPKKAIEIAEERLVQAWLRGSVTHLTTLAIDKVLEHLTEFVTDGNDKPYTPPSAAYLAAMANDYAERYAPNYNDITNLNQYIFDLRQRMREGRLSADLDTQACNILNAAGKCASVANPDYSPHTFHASARLLAMAKERDGLFYTGQIKHAFKNAKWASAKKNIAKHTAGMDAKWAKRIARFTEKSLKD